VAEDSLFAKVNSIQTTFQDRSSKAFIF